MGIGVDVVQPHPGAERAEFARQVEEARRDLALAPAARGIAEVEAVGAGVLRDDQQLLDARLHQFFGLAQHVRRPGARRDRRAAWG